MTTHCQQRPARASIVGRFPFSTVPCMRSFTLFSAIFLSMLPALGLAQDFVPQKRMVLAQDVDLPGGDIGSAFDTTLEACERACLANPSCEAFTFNTRNGSCFLKAGPGEAQP